MLRVYACVVSIAPVLFFASGVKTLSISQRVVIDLICEKFLLFFFQFFSSIFIFIVGDNTPNKPNKEKKKKKKNSCQSLSCL